MPKSTSGAFVAVVSDTGTFIPISWFSRKQGLTCVGTASAEFAALSQCSEHVAPIASIAEEIGIIKSDSTVTIRWDNQATLLAVNRSHAPYETLLNGTKAIQFAHSPTV